METCPEKSPIMKLLLIGMGAGNGLAIARRFGREGFHILMVARSENKLKAFETELAAGGIRSTGYAVDISDEPAFGALLTQITAGHPDIGILHYNASAFNPAKPSAMSIPVFENDLRINLIAAVMAVQAVFPQMKKRGSGAIFFTGGGTAFHAPPELASLAIGKAALRSLAFTLAAECRPLGIHAATITIDGMVKAGTRFDPELIADGFWRLYRQPEAEWETEVIWK